jgi:hypothetical protein
MFGAAPRKGSNAMIERTDKVNVLVCAWCDVYNRIERVHRDEDGREFMRDTVCAYCGRTELRFGRLGRQTPIPPPPAAPPDGLPF